jgi:hypothetical protein
MSEAAGVTAAADAESFAEMLTALAGSAGNSSDGWDTSELREDVATISYEQALRMHRRVPVPQPVTPTAARLESRTSSRIASPQSADAATPKGSKTASITIRLTQAEQAQLHKRAAEAQLSVSAYLRSCIFEAESLRAQVKQALSDMRAATASQQSQRSTGTEPVSEPHRRFRFLPRWPHKREVAS